MNGGAAINLVCTKPQGWGVSRTVLSGVRRGGGRRRVCGRHAFTLVEILAVTVIIVILLSIALPAFSNILYSQEESTAESQLQAGISAARDAAIRSGSAQDTAAVFTFEPGGRLSIITCVKVGSIDDPTAPASSPASYDVFVPSESGPPIQLPKNWMVRGYAPQNRIQTGPGKNGWFSETSIYPNGAPSWVFPETSFFDHTVAGDGLKRNTFMVRFEGGTGAINMADQAPVLVVLPRASGLDRPGSVNEQWKRPDRAENLRDWAVLVLSEPTLTVANERWSIIGRPSGDMVMAAPVPSVALYDETRLAAALKARVDPISGTLYAIDPAGYNAGRKIEPKLVGTLSTSTTVADDIAAWLEGWKDKTFAQRAEAWSARMYTMNKYQGTLRSVAPTAAIAPGLGG